MASYQPMRGRQTALPVAISLAVASALGAAELTPEAECQRECRADSVPFEVCLARCRGGSGLPQKIVGERKTFTWPNGSTVKMRVTKETERGYSIDYRADQVLDAESLDFLMAGCQVGLTIQWFDVEGFEIQRADLDCIPGRREAGQSWTCTARWTLPHSEAADWVRVEGITTSWARSSCPRNDEASDE